MPIEESFEEAVEQFREFLSDIGCSSNIE